MSKLNHIIFLEDFSKVCPGQSKNVTENTLIEIDLSYVFTSCLYHTDSLVIPNLLRPIRVIKCTALY